MHISATIGLAVRLRRPWSMQRAAGPTFHSARSCTSPRTFPRCWALWVRGLDVVVDVVDEELVPRLPVSLSFAPSFPSFTLQGLITAGDFNIYPSSLIAVCSTTLRPVSHSLPVLALLPVVLVIRCPEPAPVASPLGTVSSPAMRISQHLHHPHLHPNTF